MITGFWAAWTVAFAFIAPRSERKREIEHRYLQTMIDDADLV